METELDAIDVEIVRLLQLDGQRSVKELAGEVGLAPSSVHGRLRQLREAGVVMGIHAEVAPAALGIGMEALFMIALEKHERGTVDHLLDDIVAVPEVRSAMLVSGRYDLVVHVVVRDTEHLKNLAFDHFINRPGVNRIETSLLFETRRRRELPNLLVRAKEAA